MCCCGAFRGRGGREGLHGVPLMNGRRRITDAMFAHIQMPPPPQRPPQRCYTCPTFAAPSSLRCCPCLSRSEKPLGGLVQDSPSVFLRDSFGVGAVSDESSILLRGKNSISLGLCFLCNASQLSRRRSPSHCVGRPTYLELMSVRRPTPPWTWGEVFRGESCPSCQVIPLVWCCSPSYLTP